MGILEWLSKHGANQNFEAYEHQEGEGITVNNNSYLTDQSDAKNILIDNRNYSKLLVHLYNDHATNGMSYEITGHNKEIDTPPAIDSAPEDWFEVPNGIGTIAAKNSNAFILTDAWAWVLIRVKRAVASNDATLNYYIRGERK